MTIKIRLAKPNIGNEEFEAVKKVLDSGYLTEGEVTKNFEEEFAKYIGTKHAIATTSCTTALELVLRVLKAKPTDEVIVPDFTHPATAEAVLLAGAKPVLADVEIESRNISADIIKKIITPKTRYIMPVSWAGNPLDIEVYELAEERGITIIEDSACSVGAEINGKKVGSIAFASCFSFHPRKIITSGEGGMITTNDSGFADQLYSFKHFGMKNSRFTTLGTNYKISDILSAVGLMQLRKVEQIIKARTIRAQRYNELLKNIEGIKIPQVAKGKRHTFQTYTIEIPNNQRDNLRQYLLNAGIEAQIGTYALHLEPAFESTARAGTLKNSEYLYKNLLALPLHHELSEEDQLFIANKIKEYLKSH